MRFNIDELSQACRISYNEKGIQTKDRFMNNSNSIVKKFLYTLNQNFAGKYASISKTT